MQQYLKKTVIIIGLFFLSNQAIAISNDYPRTEQEQKLDRMGSLVGGEGLLFKPRKIKNTSTESTLTNNASTKSSNSRINKYLWQASLETLNFIPLASSDSNGGVIITEWYTPKESKNFRFKINIFIKDNVISPDALQIRVFEQLFKNGNWLDNNNNSSNLAIDIEDKILRKARELYISAEGK